jgi:REP element-mobilizing transposase RayT
MDWVIYQIMPNHFHAIIELKNVGADRSILPVGATLRGCPGQTQRSAPTEGTNAPRDRQKTLGNVEGRFKSLTTHRYLEGIRLSNWPVLETRLWQRNYYEHVSRDEKDYQFIFDDVICNPQNREKDIEYPLK